MRCSRCKSVYYTNHIENITKPFAKNNTTKTRLLFLGCDVITQQSIIFKEKMYNIECMPLIPSDHIEPFFCPAFDPSCTFSLLSVSLLCRVYRFASVTTGPPGAPPLAANGTVNGLLSISFTRLPTASI